MLDAQTGLRIGGTALPVCTQVGEAHTTTTVGRDYTRATSAALIDHVPTADEAKTLTSA